MNIPARPPNNGVNWLNNGSLLQMYCMPNPLNKANKRPYEAMKRAKYKYVNSFTEKNMNKL